MSSILLWSFLLATLACDEVSAIYFPVKPSSAVHKEDSPQFYNLPYGVIGFLGHIITLYILMCLWWGRRPSNPWKQLRNHSWLRRIIGILTLVTSVTFATFTIVWCSNGAGELLLQGLLNASVGVLLGCTTSSAGPHIAKPDSSSPASNDANLSESQTVDTDLKSVSSKPDDSMVSSVLPTENNPAPSPESAESQTTSPLLKPQNVWYLLWIIIYFPFAILGLTSSAIQINEKWDNHAVQLVTVAIITVAVCWSMFWISAGALAARKGPKIQIVLMFCLAIPVGLGFSVMILSPFYSDWVLGAITGNFVGLPIIKNAENFVVYWGYFVANLFPLACI